MTNNLYIFSNDLRLSDNKALFEASKHSDSLEVAFLFNPKKWENHNESPLKIRFQLANLEILKKDLKGLNINLKIIYAEGIEEESFKILKEAELIGASGVYINKEYGINERRRDADLKNILETKNINLNIFDSSIINPNLIKTGSDTFFKVFTPFWRTAEQKYLSLAPSKNYIVKKRTKEKTFFKNCIESQNILPLSLIHI